MKAKIYVTCPICGQTEDYGDLLSEDGYYNGNVKCRVCGKSFFLFIDGGRQATVSA